MTELKRKDAFKSILPALKEFSRALQIITENDDIWSKSDLTFYLLKSAFYIEGAIKEVEKQIALEKFKEEVN